MSVWWWLLVTETFSNITLLHTYCCVLTERRFSVAETSVVLDMNVPWSVWTAICTTEFLISLRLKYCTQNNTVVPYINCIYCLGSSSDIIHRVLRHRIQWERSVEEEKMESVMRDNMADSKTTPVSHSQLSSVQDPQWTLQTHSFFFLLTGSSQGVALPFQAQWSLYRVFIIFRNGIPVVLNFPNPCIFH
jgi:hypothetical protein